jgi:hypothetical protein
MERVSLKSEMKYFKGKHILLTTIKHYKILFVSGILYNKLSNILIINMLVYYY